MDVEIFRKSHKFILEHNLSFWCLSVVRSEVELSVAKKLSLKVDLALIFGLGYSHRNIQRVSELLCGEVAKSGSVKSPKKFDWSQKVTNQRCFLMRTYIRSSVVSLARSVFQMAGISKWIRVLVRRSTWLWE